MSKLPSFQFYPGDWRKDPNLSRATLAAKGAMIEIMCIAFECEQRGMLKTGGKPWSIDEIVMAMGGDPEINKSALHELIDKKILKKDRKGAIFSSRMCKDEKLRRVRKAAGSKGGNPILVNQRDNQSANQNPTPSASASLSSSSSNINMLSSEQVFEYLRTATLPENISDRQIEKETANFIKRYSRQKITNLRALCNTWADHIIPEHEKQFVE